MDINLRISERVAKGVELLDWASPGWDAKINLHKLAVADCDYCITGSLPDLYPISTPDLYPGSLPDLYRISIRSLARSLPGWIWMG